MKQVLSDSFKLVIIFVLLMGCLSHKEQKEKTAVKNKTDSTADKYHHKGVLDVQYLGNGQALSIGRDSLIILWNIHSGQAVKVKRLPRLPFKLAFNKRQNEWWVVCQNGILYQISVNNLQIKKTIPTVLQNITQLNFSNPLDVFWGKDVKELFQFNPQQNNIKILSGTLPKDAVIALHAVQPLMAVFSGKTITVKDARTLKLIGKLNLPHFKKSKSNERHLAFAGDNLILATYNENIWMGNWQKKMMKKLPKNHHAPITALTVSDNDSLIATGSMDKSIKLWKIPSGELQASLYGHFLTVTSLVFADSGHKLISGSEDSNLLIWNMKNKQQEKRLGSLNIAVQNPWKLTVKRIKYARYFKVGREEYNVSDRKTKLLKVYAEVKNTGLADNMFFSSNLFLIAPDQSKYHCVGLENYVALSPKAYFKQQVAPNSSIKGNFIFIITPPYKNYSIAYETLTPVSLKNY